MHETLSPLLIVVLLVGGLATVLFLRGLLLRKAITKVVRIFRQHHSSCSEASKNIDELGLRPLDFPEKMFKPKDYKPFAVEALIQADIIRVTKDGKACLDEQKLEGTALEDPRNKKPSLR
jgi:hypothetical protein